MTALDHQVDQLVAAWLRIREADQELAAIQLQAMEELARALEERPARRAAGGAA